MICACVIVYNFHDNVQGLIVNINSYINYVEKLYIIDNSTFDSNDFFKFNEKIVYVANLENLGIAKALNIACDKAITDGFEFILTMDQDSKFDGSCLSSYLYNISQLLDKKEIAVFSPNSINVGKCDSNSLSHYIHVLTAITSGSILNLKIYKSIGGFKNKLFIDEVDNEYCLRANVLGYKVINFNNIYLNHNLGTTERLIFNLYHKTHPPVRIYYMSRNNFYIWTKYIKVYPFYVLRVFKLFLTKIVVIILFEKEKKEKLYYAWRGAIDFFRNKFGKYQK